MRTFTMTKINSETAFQTRASWVVPILDAATCYEAGAVIAYLGLFCLMAG